MNVNFLVAGIARNGNGPRAEATRKILSARDAGWG